MVVEEYLDFLTMFFASIDLKMSQADQVLALKVFGRFATESSL